MDDGTNVSYLIAFGAGIMIFFSPCIFPLIPTYLSYLVGVSFKELSGEAAETRKGIRKVTVIHSLMFVLGFSLVFILLGTAVTSIGRLLYDYQAILAKAGAVLIIIFGLFIMGILKIGFLAKEAKIGYKKKAPSFFGSFLVGATFALAWTPCVGPILGSILVYASSTASMYRGMLLLTVFSMGLAIPFMLSAIMLNSFLAHFDKAKKYLKTINFIGGAILIIFGIMILIGGIR